MLPRGRVYRYPPGRGLPDVPMPGVAGGMFSVPYDMGGMPMRDATLSQPIPIGALASALANATPDQQRTVSMFYTNVVFSLGCQILPLEHVEHRKNKGYCPTLSVSSLYLIFLFRVLNMK